MGKAAVVCVASCLALVLGQRQAKAQDTGDNCPRGLRPPFTVFSNSCYQFVSTEMTWESARQYCRQQSWPGGKLVTVPDIATQNWIVGRLSSMRWTNNGVWLGLNDRAHERRFVWDEYDGRDTLATFFNWYPGEPAYGRNQDCVYMRRQYGWRWVDVECSWTPFRTYSFICQYRLTGNATATPSTARATASQLSSATAPPATTLRTSAVSASLVLNTDRGPTPSSNAAAEPRSANQTLVTTDPGGQNATADVAWTTSADSLASRIASLAWSSALSAGGSSLAMPPWNRSQEAAAAVPLSSSLTVAETAWSAGTTALGVASGEIIATAALTNTAPADERAEPSYRSTSGSVYASHLASSEVPPTIGGDGESDVTLRNRSTTSEPESVAAASTALVESLTRLPAGSSSDQADPEVACSPTTVGATGGAASEAVSTVNSSGSLRTTVLRDLFSTDMSSAMDTDRGTVINSASAEKMAADSEPAAAPHGSEEEDDRHQDLSVYVGVGVSIALLVLVAVVAVLLLKHNRKLQCHSSQNYHVHQIHIENPAYLSWDPNESTALSHHLDGSADVQLKRHSQDRDINRPLLKHAGLT